MINKRLMFFVIFFICLLAISGVSASEIDDDIAISDDALTIDAGEIDNDNLESTDLQLDENVDSKEMNDEGNFKSSSNSEFLTDDNPGTFTDLANEIENANGELNLTRNYRYVEEDSDFEKGIVINRPVTINGNGMTIDGNHMARIFYVTGQNVVLHNINFVNGFSGDGSGGTVTWNKGMHSYPSFNKTDFSGGSIYWSGTDGTIDNCSFINSDINLTFSSYIDYINMPHYTPANGSYTQSVNGTHYVDNYCYGGAVYWDGANGKLNDCNFINCNISSSIFTGLDTPNTDNRGTIYSYCYGGAIYWHSENGTCTNCNFINCGILSNSTCNSLSSKVNSSYVVVNNDIKNYCYGGAICWIGSNSKISNCTFTNSSFSSKSFANASSSGSCQHCFANSYIFCYGGDVFINGSNNVMDNDNFINSLISTNSTANSSRNAIAESEIFGGAIYCIGFNNNLTNTNISNSYSSSLSRVIIRNEFTNHIFSFSNGGAVYWKSSNSTISNCTFVNSSLNSSVIRGQYSNDINCSSFGGAVYWDGDDGLLENCNFVNNSANSLYSSSGGAVYWNGANGTLSDSNFVNSYALNGSNAIFWKGEDGYIINYTFDSETNQLIISSQLRIPIKTEIKLNNIHNMLINDDVVIKPLITAGATGNINIYLDGVLLETIKAGSDYTLSNLNIGKHNVTLIYDGSVGFEACNFSTEFYTMAIYPIDSEDTQIIYGSNNYFQAKFYDIEGNALENKIVIFKINNDTDFAKFTNSEGIAYLDVDLDYGNYSVTIINPILNEEKINNLLIFTSIESEDITLENGENFVFTSKFLDNIANPLKDTYVVFNINNKDYAVQTDENGIASLNINLDDGTYNITLINPITDESKVNKITIGTDPGSGSGNGTGVNGTDPGSVLVVVMVLV